VSEYRSEVKVARSNDIGVRERQSAAWRLSSSDWYVADDPVSLIRETVVALFVTAYSTLLGGAVGLVWHAVAPKIALIVTKSAINAPMTYKVFLSDDLTFALVGVVAGILIVLVLVGIGGDAAHGPGAVIGLAAGGVLGALVAAHVGHQIGQHALTSTIHHYVPTAPAAQVKPFIQEVGFTLRWRVGLFAWPFAAVGVLAGIVALRRDSAVHSDHSDRSGHMGWHSAGPVDDRR